MDEQQQRAMWAAIPAVVAATIALLKRFTPKVFKRAWTAIRKSVTTKGDISRRVDSKFNELLAQIQGLSKQVGVVAKQVNPDSGGSMHDRLLSIGREVRVIGAEIQAYMESAEHPMGRMNDKGELTWANVTFLQWIEASIDSIRGWGWVHYIADFDQERVRKTWERAVAEGTEFKSRHTMRSSSGREFPVEVVARRVIDPVSRDISGWVWQMWARKLTGQHEISRNLVPESDV